MSERADLPDLDQLDPQSLKALIRAQHAELLSKDEQLLSRDTEIEHLKLLIAKLRREQFGRSSEKLDRQIAQLELRLGELEASRAQDIARGASAGLSPVLHGLILLGQSLNFSGGNGVRNFCGGHG
jgi:hypothetical protein